MSKYDPKKIEKKWQTLWLKNKTFFADEKKNKEKKMILVEFPYPSGAGLHMGHMRPFVAGDVVAKYFKLKGEKVMYPMGWDAFGLPAENFAIKNKVHPSVSTKKNVANTKQQLISWGTGFDWSREINTTDPDYYKWTQQIFLEFFKKGLAYEKFGEINWCPKDKTGLANEEVVDGKCERCGTFVEKKNLRQWYLKITDYAESLIEGLEDLPEWPEAIKTQQRNWVGRSEGAELKFKVKTESLKEETEITVFTTRADTLFGVTYVVLAPEHELVAKLLANRESRIESREEIQKYIDRCKNKTEEDRTNDKKEKTGVEIKGVVVLNPATNESVPVWVADYVLPNYGTGAVMAVPAHDKRDFEFATKYNLPIKKVILGNEDTSEENVLTLDGLLTNSGQFSGLTSEEARKKIIEFVVGKNVLKYRLRDWVFSRQRYWGEPIPLIHCKRCGTVPVPEKDLPVRLPNVKNYEPTGTGESPLANIQSFVDVACPNCIEDSKKTKYLVFDFDGVIGDTYEATLKNYLALGHAQNQKEAEERMDEWFDRKPEHMSQNEFTKEERKERIKYTEEFGTSLLQFKMGLFKNFVKEIKKLKNVKLAVVSAGSALYVKPLVKTSGIKFTHVYTGEDSMKKGESVLKVAKDWKIDPKEIYYFTDAVSDYYELEHFINPKKIIGCAWGFLGEAKLKKLLSESEILRKPEDIHNLFKPLIGKRETNTMPQWAGSSWYWLRYMDPKNTKEFASIENQEFWSPVDLYFGGMEHTTLHLLYSRFWNHFLFDQKLVTVKEPYKKRIPHGIILGPDGEKMSKSRGNVVNPDELVKLYGADTVRLYMMFLGPHGAQVAWNDKGIVGARRFIEKVFSLSSLFSKEESKPVKIAINKTIKKVSEDIETFAFNTAVSSLMICVNTIIDQKQITKVSYKKLLITLAPFIPHSAEELWANLGAKKSIFEESFPRFDADLIAEEKINIAVQINGKTRTILTVTNDISDEDLVAEALKDPKIGEVIKGQKIQKTIVIKGKIVSLVVSN